MERPNIKTFFGEDVTLAQVHEKYIAAPELYKYMQALDAYIDHLFDEKPDNKEPAEIKDWTIPDEKGVIHVPDELDALINKIGFQIRFLTISGKDESQTIADIAWIAQQYFAKANTLKLGMNFFDKSTNNQLT